MLLFNLSKAQAAEEPDVNQELDRFEEDFRRRISQGVKARLDLLEAPGEVEEREDVSDLVQLSPAGPPVANIIVKEENSSDTKIPPSSTKLELLELKNTEIQDALKLIAVKGGFNIAASSQVAGKVNIYLKDIDAREALKIILEMNNWAYVEEDGIIKVLSDKEFETRFGYRFGDQMETRFIKLLHADVNEIILSLNQMKSAAGRIIADKISNSLVVTDLPGLIRGMEDFIGQVDAARTTEVFQLNYAETEEASKKITEFLTKNIGRVEIDTRLNKLIVTDVPQKMPKIQKIIEAIDQKTKEVYIESKIIQIILSDEHKMGVDWEGLVSDYHDLDLKGSFGILEDSEKQGQVSVGTIAADQYKFLIEALETVGTTNLLSSPRVSVANNKDAKILVGSTEPYITSTTVTPSSGPTTTSETVNFIEVGVKLYVTPTIHSDGFITMKVKPEVSSVTRTISTSNNNVIPVVETSEAETTVVIKDGATVVIGGLLKDEKIRTVKKVPLLGNIPLLGRAFQNKSDLIRKTELVIFLTPRIITGSGEERSSRSGYFDLPGNESL